MVTERKGLEIVSHLLLRQRTKTLQNVWSYVAYGFGQFVCLAVQHLQHIFEAVYIKYETGKLLWVDGSAVYQPITDRVTQNFRQSAVQKH